MLPKIFDDELDVDIADAWQHVRNAWLHLHAMDHLDAGTGGGYAFDPSDYAPVPVEQDGKTTVVFART